MKTQGCNIATDALCDAKSIEADGRENSWKFFTQLCMKEVKMPQPPVDERNRAKPSKTSASKLLSKFGSSPEGLDDDEATLRLKSNKKLSKPKWIRNILLFLSQFKSPLVWILMAAVLLSSSFGDYVNSSIILAILTLNGILGFWQESKAGDAIEKLKSLVAVTADVRRSGQVKKITFDQVVTGDIVELNAGDIIPGDGIIIESNDLHVNEAALTGESFPMEKFALNPEGANGYNKRNMVFLGTNVVNGSAVMLVIAHGDDTKLGTISQRLGTDNSTSTFENGIRQFSYLLLQVTVALSIIILLLNLYLDKPVIDSALFALALAIGMTPELLPVIVTICLSTGAKRMVEKKVVVKKLTAIQNLGSLDIFCTDKTGTLTEGTIKVHSAVDIHGLPNDKVLRYASWNARFETGFTNPIDEALRNIFNEEDGVTKIDEVPYDFIRKRLSIVVKEGNDHLMITKGSLKNILQICNQVELVSDKVAPIGDFRGSILRQLESFGEKGFRTLGVCYKHVSSQQLITKEDEAGMTFLGFILLFDPPKAGVRQSLQTLRESGVDVKLVTGDNVRVAAFLANQIGLATKECLTGNDLIKMTDEALMKKAEAITVFAEMEPYQKERIVKVLQKAGHTVGFIGDGINDASAMRAADVGISVDTAVDVARETADIVLLEKDLAVLHDGIQEGRRTFGNTLKYIFLTTSANFGNMFSVAAASIMLPFLPLLPKQILLINFLTDIPAMALSSDSISSDFLKSPKRWNNVVIRNFMIVFGLISAVFDILTFTVLLAVFDADMAQFRAAWFVECVLTELLFIIIIRSHLPVYKNKPSKALIAIIVLVILASFFIMTSPFNLWMEFGKLSAKIFVAMLILVVFFGIATEIAKQIFFKNQKGSLNY
jgi:Mg2+-importing ATPase